MILAGFPCSPTAEPLYPSRHPALVTFQVDTEAFAATVNSVVRSMLRLDFALETAQLAVHQVEALMYVRGGMDPDFATEAARDNYLRAIIGNANHGPAAAAAFLRGWFTRPGTATGTEPFVWHRFFGGDSPVAVEVSAS